MASSKTSWELITEALIRIKVDGGHLYETLHGLCFVPDVDLTRYQSHLRDAYNQGYKDGRTEAEQHWNRTAE